MKRRNFLGAAAWFAVKPVFGQNAGAPVYPNAVPIVPDPAAAGLSAAQTDVLFAVDQAMTLASQAQTFPQSVASGDPSPNGIVLWTRVDPSVQGGATPNQVAFQISKTPAFDTLVLSGTGQLDATGKDNTVKLPIARGLQPFTVYYYRFIYNTVASRTGRFKTLPGTDTNLPELRLGYVVCQDYGNGYYTALQYLAQEEVDYVVHLGDYIYETISSPSFQNNPARTVPPFSDPSKTVPSTVDDYRHLYKVYRSDPNQQAVHERFAYIQLWDDHEFANDCHQDFHPDNNTGSNTATTPQPDLRQAANQAWSEYGLADVPFDPTKDWENSLQVYRKFSFGKLADLIVTDERLYRDGPPCGNAQIFQRYFSPGCPALANPNRTMLGGVQRDWFLSQVLGSQATWKLWANEVMLMQLKIAGFIYADLDQWDGYPKERASILSQIGQANVKNFVALTGDLHTFLAGYLKPNFDDLLQAPVGVELMVGSISSANLAEEITSAVHLPSSPLPAKQFGVPPNLLQPLIQLNNPHIQYWDSSTHGYGILDITPQRLVCTFKAVTTIRSPQANLVTLKTLTIPNGQVKLIQS